MNESVIPRMTGKLGLAGVGSLARSTFVKPKSQSAFPKLADQVPKLSLSSSVSEMIDRVADGANPREVVEKLMEPHNIERQASDTSPEGSRTGREILLPGANVGIRGPHHNGHHAIISVDSKYVRMKNDKGYEETVPIKDLDDHEVVHSLETV